jgi:hypothetical protein
VRCSGRWAFTRPSPKARAQCGARPFFCTYKLKARPVPEQRTGRPLRRLAQCSAVPVSRRPPMEPRNLSTSIRTLITTKLYLFLTFDYQYLEYDDKYPNQGQGPCPVRFLVPLLSSGFTVRRRTRSPGGWSYLGPFSDSSKVQSPTLNPDGPLPAVRAWAARGCCQRQTGGPNTAAAWQLGRGAVPCPRSPAPAPASPSSDGHGGLLGPSGRTAQNRRSCHFAAPGGHGPGHYNPGKATSGPNFRARRRPRLC